MQDLKRRKNLRSENLTKSYKGRVVVRSVSFHVEQGEVVGLLGPNGAGKTTTFYMVVGLTPPESGSVFIDAHEITDLPMYLRARQGLSYLPQEPSVFRKLTVSENIMAILEMLNFNGEEKRQRMRDLMGELGLEHVADSKAYTLSGGERRRVEIARALATSPSFMLLDEPFAGIDPIAVADIQSIISKLRDSGIGILITDHNVRETLKITDRAYIINNGEIFRSGSPVELSSDPEVKKVYLGETFKLD
jgi:lipopolysaccharide export system ATP-binding protein